eukprot:scaffold71588_cov47-Attheya_sp.AAC.3
MSYELDGFLRENRTQIHQALKQYHLIEVASGALVASDLAQSEQMEEETRAAKRARIEQHQAILDESESCTLEEVLSNELGGYLDFMSLYCMSRVCHKFHNGAKRIVSERLRTAKFSIIPLVDGMKQYGPDKLDGYDSLTFETGDIDDPVWRYRMQAKVDVEFDDEQNENGCFRPCNRDTVHFFWNSGFLSVGSGNYYSDDDYQYNNSGQEYEEDYMGQILKLYWHPDPHDGVEVPRRFSVYGRQLPSLGIFLGSVCLYDTPDVGITRKRLLEDDSFYIEYEVLRSSREEREIENEETQPDAYSDDESELEVNDASDDESEHENDASDDKSELEVNDASDDESEHENERQVQFSGEVHITKLKIHFGVLLSKVAEQQLRRLKSEHAKISESRPLRSAEVETMAELLKAAGLA